MNRPILYSVTVCAMLLLCGFLRAVTPEELPLDEAIRSMEMARSAGAEIYAPLDLHFAEKRLEQARLALQAKDKAVLQRISEEVIVTCELASVKSRLAKMREQVEAKSHENARLRDEVLGEKEVEEHAHDDL